MTSDGTYLGYLFLQVEINKSTLKPVSGMVTVSSDQDWDGFLDGDLDFSGGNLDSLEAGERAYSTDLAHFGFGGYGLFNFIFGNGAGDLSKPEDDGLLVVVMDGIFDATGPYSLPTGWDTFQYDFENNNTGKADVPEPATLGLLATAGLGVLLRRKR